MYAVTEYTKHFCSAKKRATILWTFLFQYWTKLKSHKYVKPPKWIVHHMSRSWSWIQKSRRGAVDTARTPIIWIATVTIHLSFSFSHFCPISISLPNIGSVGKSEWYEAVAVELGALTLLCKMMIDFLLISLWWTRLVPKARVRLSVLITQNFLPTLIFTWSIFT